MFLTLCDLFCRIGIKFTWTLGQEWGWLRPGWSGWWGHGYPLLLCWPGLCFTSSDYSWAGSLGPWTTLFSLSLGSQNPLYSWETWLFTGWAYYRASTTVGQTLWRPCVPVSLKSWTTLAEDQFVLIKPFWPFYILFLLEDHTEPCILQWEFSGFTTFVLLKDWNHSYHMAEPGY